MQKTLLFTPVTAVLAECIPVSPSNKKPMQQTTIAKIDPHTGAPRSDPLVASR